MDLTPPPQPPEIGLQKNSAPADLPAEKDLAALFGVSRDVLKKIRDAQLKPDEHWLPGQPIRYTAAGVAVARAALGLPVAQEEPSSADAGTVAPAGPVRETLTVERPARGCTHIVICQTADGRTVNLRVKSGSNGLFTRGMQVPNCAQHHNAPCLYNYEGRLPRRKGVLR